MPSPYANGRAGGPVRILYLDNSYTFGGAINSLMDLVRGLDRTRFEPVVATGQECTVVTSRADGVACYRVEPALPWTEDGVYRRVLASRAFRSRPARKLAAAVHTAYWVFLRKLPEAVRFARIGRRHGVGIVHLNNNVESQLSGAIAARLLGVPCIAHSRCFQEPHWNLRLADRLIDHHVAISDAIKANLVSAGISPDKVTVVHNGIDLREFGDHADADALRAELGLRPGERAIGLFGRIVAWKGTMEFVRAVHRVIREIPHTRAFVVGDVSDGGQAYFEEVRGAIRDLGLEDHVVLTGFRKDVPALMKAMDVVVHASTEPEPFGRVLIEGMAMGKPIVATEGGGPDEVVVRGETGLLVPRGDAAALGEAIAEVLRDPARAEEMGRRGRERVLRYFTKESYATRVMKLYRDVLSRRSVVVPASANPESVVTG